MESRMLIAGFGGQGVILAGQIIAEAAMKNEKNVTWMPSYGPEMRGGSANCAVVISDDIIGSPIVNDPEILIAMNIPSFELFESSVKEGGYIIYNSSLINDITRRDNVIYIPIPCNDIANDLGVNKVVNMPIIGALSSLLGIISVDDLYNVMLEKFGESKEKLIKLNMDAIKIGVGYIGKLTDEKI